MLIIPYLLFVLGLLLVAAPGIICWTILFPNDSPEERIAWGSVLGIASAVYVAHLCSFIHLSWFYRVWAGLLMLSVGGIFWSRAHSSASPGPPSEVTFGSSSSPAILLTLLLLLVVVLQGVVVMQSPIPRGWDPTFHLLLAKKIALSNHSIRDWMPFDNAALNYPIGSHFMIVLFAWFSGLSLPLTFQMLMVTFSVLAALAIYVLAAEYFTSRTIGLYAAIAYSLWAFWGSADYLLWGGLPNELGMLIGLEILGLVIRNGERKRTTALIGLLFAAVCITHHHVMVTLGLILIVQMLIFLAIRDPERRYLTIFFGLALAGIAASLFLVPYVLKAVSLSDTRVFHIHDVFEPMTMGLVLVPFAIAGAALDYWRKSSSPHVLHSVCATLILLYVLFGPASWFYHLLTTGDGYVGFTPSRFLSDLSYFFSIFAGYALFRFQKRFGLSGAVTVTIALLLGLTNIPQWQDLMVSDADPGRFATYQWIAKNTPANSIVETKEAWACYATWRRTLRTPMPISEPRVPPHISDTAELELVNGLAPAELRGIEVLDIFAPGQRREGKLLWSSPDGWAVALKN